MHENNSTEDGGMCYNVILTEIFTPRTPVERPVRGGGGNAAKDCVSGLKIGRQHHEEFCSADRVCDTCLVSAGDKWATHTTK